jgi:hypothetical protein
MNTISAGNTTSAKSVSVDKPQLAHSVRNGLFCALALAAAVVISNPSADMPFLDEFSYDKTALEFARTGNMVYNGWATAMLGWQVPWGALFIKLFGFSFTGMRLSMLPLAMLSVFLFHQILRRFGVSAQNSVMGALTLGISPVFLPMATSFMTDVPGLLVILACIYMCQRAVAATSDRVALLWLCTAAAVNVAGGTVRQIAWLGALIMVPSTGWLMRRRKGMKVAAVLLFLFAFAGVEVCMHWFARQPYSVPEQIIAGPIHARMLVHLGAQLLKVLFCLLLVISPISVAWLSTGWRFDRNARRQFLGAMVLLLFAGIGLYARGILDGWLMPWLTPLIASQASQVSGFLGMTSATITLWTRIALSLLVIAPAIVLVEQIAAQNPNKMRSIDFQADSWREIGWIVCPFSLSYLLLLFPRATFSHVQDRYLLGLIPLVIIVLLRLFQERVSDKMPLISLITLGVFGAYSIAGTYSIFAWSRAMVNATQVLQDSGVPRTSFEAGLADDGWVQIQGGGHVNDPHILVPAGAYHEDLDELRIPPPCRYEFSKFMPAITPKYFIIDSPMSCLASTKFPPVHYTTWLPPFHRFIYVQQLK